MGVKDHIASAWEHDEALPTATQWQALADILGLPVDFANLPKAVLSDAYQGLEIVLSPELTPGWPCLAPGRRQSLGFAIYQLLLAGDAHGDWQLGTRSRLRRGLRPVSISIATAQ